MRETFLVEYVGNTKGMYQMESWIGSVFEVYDDEQYYTVVRIVQNTKGFRLPRPDAAQTFYKYNARRLSPEESSAIKIKEEVMACNRRDDCGFSSKNKCTFGLDHFCIGCEFWCSLTSRMVKCIPVSELVEGLYSKKMWEL